jgi:hypothetical protein
MNPYIPQVARFDTAIHREHPKMAYALIVHSRRRQKAREEAGLD